MTTFIASLFLPYTINFRGEGELSGQTSTHIVSHHINPASVRQTTSERSADIAGHSATESTTTASGIPLSASKEKLHALARTDFEAAEWGSSLTLNQPTSQTQISDTTPSSRSHYRRRNGRGSPRATRDGKRAHSVDASMKKKTFTGDSYTVEYAVQGNGGLTNAIRAASDLDLIPNKYYIGTLGFPTDDLADETKESIDEKLEFDCDCLTVYAKDTDFDGHYRQYCKTILWPILHYQIPDHPKSKAYEDHSWVYYVQVNQAFADKIVSNYKHGDTVWIHDYHLLLCPLMIRKRIPEAKIGFFLHTPFPSSEIFRCLPTRQLLLNGMLGANVVVFQAGEYAYHFLQTCSHLLSVQADEHGVQLEDRFVGVTDCPFGILPDQLNLGCEDVAVARWTRDLAKQYEGKKVIVGSDKLEKTRGLRQKLLAYEMFLNNNPSWAGQVVMIQVAMSTAEDPTLASALNEIVMRIDAHHSTLAHQPIVLLKQDIALAEYLAMLGVADVLMITSLRDGMNLACHEYVVCQDGRFEGGKKHGAVILSEFTGAAAVFGMADTIPVNPWNLAQCADAIALALEMPSEVRQHRHHGLMSSIMECNSIAWTQSLSAELDAAVTVNQQRDTVSVPRLSATKLCQEYGDTSERLFFLAYEGTLAAWGSPAKSVLANPQRVVDVLLSLLSNEDIVYVTSALPPSELERLFRRLPGLGLIAETGCFVRPYSPELVARDWINCAATVNRGWQKTVSKVLQYYIERIPGSRLEYQNCSIILHYADAHGSDAEAAFRIAGDCANHINNSCTDLGVRAIHAEKAVRVALRMINKTTACSKVFEHERLRLAGRLNEEAMDIWTRFEPSFSGTGTPSRGRSRTISSTASRTVSQSRLMSASPPASATDLLSSPVGRRLKIYAGSPTETRQRAEKRTLSPGSPTPLRFYPSEGESGYASDESSLLPVATMRSLQSDTSHALPFLMVAGDSAEDEAVFRWANALEREGSVRHAVSVSVGERTATEAKYTLSLGCSALLNALCNLART